MQLPEAYRSIATSFFALTNQGIPHILLLKFSSENFKNMIYKPFNPKLIFENSNTEFSINGAFNISIKCVFLRVTFLQSFNCLILLKIYFSSVQLKIRLNENTNCYLLYSIVKVQFHLYLEKPKYKWEYYISKIKKSQIFFDFFKIKFGDNLCKTKSFIFYKNYSKEP